MTGIPPSAHGLKWKPCCRAAIAEINEANRIGSIIEGVLAGCSVVDQ